MLELAELGSFLVKLSGILDSWFMAFRGHTVFHKGRRFAGFKGVYAHCCCWFITLWCCTSSSDDPALLVYPLASKTVLNLDKF